MKKYRLNEEEDSFKIITEEGNKDIIVNGASVYEKYFKPLDIKIERIAHNPEFPEIYICANDRYSDKECNIVVSSKDGGKICDHVFKEVKRYVSRINGKMTSSPYMVVEEKKDKQVFENLLDNDFNLLIPQWADTVRPAYGTPNIFIVFKDNETDNGGTNLFDADRRKYLLEEWQDDIDSADGNGIIKPVFITTDKIWLKRIYDTEGNCVVGAMDKIHENELEFKKDMLSDESSELTTFECVTEGTNYDVVYVAKDGELPEPIKPIMNGKELGYGEYKLASPPSPRSPEKSNLYHNMISDRHEDYFNYLNSDGELQFDKWLDGYDFDGIPDKICGLPCFLIRRDDKYNFVSMLSYLPFFDKDEWIDDYKILFEDDDDSRIVAVRRNGKCNLLSACDHDDPDDYRWSGKIFMLDKWADDIMQDNNGFLFARIGDEMYFIYGNSTVRDIVAAFEGNNEIIFLRNKYGKWNCFFDEPYRKDDIIRFILGDEYHFVDAVYDLESIYPIIGNEGYPKGFTYLDTEDEDYLFKTHRVDMEEWENYFGKINSDKDGVIWFDDCEPFEGNGRYEFKVKINNKLATVDNEGEIIKEGW